ncbi:LacI family DNA-binding transcriptional regulator [Pontivivens insulae]|uniref:HTH-type transcriptional regulator RafR n=1 Tax=Pontivivens insulae TaxID=1639689 RepID=A0A2R8A6H1_9RHOB|nr:substrate-binding domain-containing protein [Pontivivens insulae]RED17948.1 LacI family transcriptional regulator [Pontivivens insulae]SPF27837.1 HTH-type transcriptional regulator RafR [Pontivivens insulae]
MTLKELAQKIGLSPTTVSRALNGYPEVNAETRARVEEAAAKYGYQPNNMARRLATGRAMAIGHVIPLTEHQMINPVFAEFMLGASEIYSEQGYDTILRTVDVNGEEDAYRELARRRAVDGVIVHAPRRDDPRIALLRELNMPFVMHGRPVEADEGSVWLDINNHRSFAEATRHLIGLGHSKIALINGLERISFAVRRRAGVEEALGEAGIDIRPDWIISQEMTETNGYAAAERLLSSGDRPTAILTSNIMTAIGAGRAARDAGLTLGQDLSLITHDDDLSFLSNAGDPPRFTAMRSSISEAGHKCAEMLLNLIAGESVSPVVWNSVFVQGRSTGPLE